AWGSPNVHFQKPEKLGVRTVLEVGGKMTTRPAWVTPDFSLSGPSLLMDAKYKGRAGEMRNRISESDLYEALAFARAWRGRYVVLLYPAIAQALSPKEPGTSTVFERVTVDDVGVIGMEIEVRGISAPGALRQFATNIKACCEAVASGH